MRVEALHKQIDEAEKHLKDLRSQLHEAEQSPRGSDVTHAKFPPQTDSAVHTDSNASNSQVSNTDRPLDLEEYKRYGRQMIVPCFGLEGQAVRWLMG